MEEYKDCDLQWDGEETPAHNQIRSNPE